jgi:hypothetical protein
MLFDGKLLIDKLLADKVEESRKMHEMDVELAQLRTKLAERVKLHGIIQWQAGQHTTKDIDLDVNEHAIRLRFIWHEDGKFTCFAKRYTRDDPSGEPGYNEMCATDEIKLISELLREV